MSISTFFWIRRFYTFSRDLHLPDISFSAGFLISFFVVSYLCFIKVLALLKLSRLFISHVPNQSNGFRTPDPTELVISWARFLSEGAILTALLNKINLLRRCFDSLHQQCISFCFLVVGNAEIQSLFPIADQYDLFLCPGDTGVKEILLKESAYLI